MKENIFGKLLNRIGDILYLNLLWMLCSIPLITMGAATTAAYYAVLQWNDGDMQNTRLNFFASFKQNLKQSTICWILCLTAALIGMEGLRLAATAEGLLSDILYAFAAFEIMLTIAFAVLLFPILANFELSIIDAFRNSVYLMFRYVWYMLAVIATVMIGVWVILTMAPPMLAIGGGLLIYLNGCVFKRVFTQITKEIHIDAAP